MENQIQLVDTPTAARMIGRAGQTLRGWSSRGDGPIQPVPYSRRGRLMWRVSDIEALINATGPGEAERGNQ